MKTLTIPLPGRAYDIEIANGILSLVGEKVKAVLPKAKKLLVVTDSNVYPLYGERLLCSLRNAGYSADTHIIPAGEHSKCLMELDRIYQAATAFGMTRTDAIIALGGGVVGDLAGFAAATLYRGIAYIQVPTTLLAQVDSSVGGKTAIDLPGGKNLVGAFWQPKAVYMDPECLKTLPDTVFSDGMTEVIKYGCISDAMFFEFLDRCGDRAGVMEHIEEVLSTCCRIKAAVVTEDETDVGIRMILNFGHTLGHAYELAGHYELYTHGQAVAAGMCMAAKLGENTGVTTAGVAQKIVRIVEKFGLPSRITCSAEDYTHAIGLDKKATGDEIRLILLSEMGKAERISVGKDSLITALQNGEKGATSFHMLQGSWRSLCQ